MDLLNKYEEFLNTFFENFNQLGIDVSTFEMDHIAYYAASAEEYDQIKEYFKRFGEFHSEAIVGERRVGVVKLDEKLTYKQYQISAIEVVEPIPGEKVEGKWDHPEFVIDCSFEELIKKYPNIDWDTKAIDRDIYAKIQLNLDNGMRVKFHKEPVLEERSS